MASGAELRTLVIVIQPDHPGADRVKVAGVALAADRWHATDSGTLVRAVARGTVLWMVQGRFGCRHCTP